MMKKKNFTYEDWLNCSVLIKGRLFIPAGANPKIVDWDRFSEEEKIQIKTKQKEIFDDSVRSLLEKFQLSFNKNFVVSDAKDELLNAELEQCIEVFKSEILPSSFFSTSHWNAVFTYEDIIEIQRFYRSVIIRGQNFNLDFIQPPKSIYVKAEFVHPEVYGTALWQYYKWLQNYFSKPNTDKTELFIEYLNGFGFFNLSKVKVLEKQNALLIATHSFQSGLPYSIAMFNYLGFFTHLMDKYFKTYKEMHEEVAKWFNVSKDGRSIRGNINVLTNLTSENKKKYTSHLYIEQVVKDYENIKSGVPLSKTPKNPC